MPKKKGVSGKKNRKLKKVIVPSDHDIQYKEDFQEYGQVNKLLGDCRVEVLCNDGVNRIGHIRGKIVNKIWIGYGDIVLVSLREFDDEKCDVILKYTEEHVRKLKAEKLIPEWFYKDSEYREEFNNDLIEFLNFYDDLPTTETKKVDEPNKKTQIQEEIDIDKI
jgi:translation initiation factor 1A